MVKLYDDFKDKGLAVISVSLDERKAAWTQAIQKDGLEKMHKNGLRHPIAPSSLTTDMLGGLPASYLKY